MEGFDELRFGKFLGIAFDHDDFGFAADVNEIEIAFFTLGMCGIGHELAIDPAHAHSPNGVGEGDV